MLACLHLGRVFLCFIAQRLNIGMAIQRIAVKAHLCVKHQQLTAFGFDQRVNFHHFAVHRHERSVKLLAQLLRGLIQRAIQLQRIGQGAAMMRHKTLCRINSDSGDFLWRVMRNCLNIHAALG